MENELVQFNINSREGIEHDGSAETGIAKLHAMAQVLPWI